MTASFLTWHSPSKIIVLVALRASVREAGQRSRVTVAVTAVKSRSAVHRSTSHAMIRGLTLARITSDIGFHGCRIGNDRAARTAVVQGRLRAI